MLTPVNITYGISKTYQSEKKETISQESLKNILSSLNKNFIDVTWVNADFSKVDLQVMPDLTLMAFYLVYLISYLIQKQINISLKIFINIHKV